MVPEVVATLSRCFQSVFSVGLEHLENWAKSRRVYIDGVECARICDVRSLIVEKIGDEITVSGLVHAKLKHNIWYRTSVTVGKEGFLRIFCACNKVTRYFVFYFLLSSHFL
jgi:hypothetical protein